MSRLTIDITDNQHQSLKALAALQGKTIRQYALERLFPGHPDEDPAWQELKTLLSQRIAEGLAGGVSATSIEAIVDEELGGEEARLTADYVLTAGAEADLRDVIRYTREHWGDAQTRRYVAKPTPRRCRCTRRGDLP